MSRKEMALGADLLMLAQGVTDFLTNILGKLKVKLAVPQTCRVIKNIYTRLTWVFVLSCVNTVNHGIKQESACASPMIFCTYKLK